MAATPTLTDLADGRYATEPLKRGKPNWTLNSRYIIIHLFYNVLGEKAPRNLPKGKLPSVDAASLEKMSVPIALRLIKQRSAVKALQSIANALTFVKPQQLFAPGLASPTEQKAVVRFNTVGYDNIERVFSMAKRSIPLNLDKAGRRAFVTPASTFAAEQITDPATRGLLASLYTAPVEDTDEDVTFDEVGSDE